MVAAAVIGAGVVGAAGSAYASKQAGKAAKTQAASADRASQIQWDMYDQTRQDLDPYKQAGETSLSQMMDQMGANGYFNQTYTGQDIYNDPSYQFRLQQGQDAIESSAAAKGGLLSGATLKALQNYGQDMASQEYSNAYNRFNADQTNRYNRLSNLVGIGQNAAAQVGNAGAQTAQAVANNTMQGANALAAGQVASANNWANTANNLGSMATSYAMMKNSGVI
ncbi:DNA transfer protein p32 [Acinetobacter baumannii]